MCAMTWGEAKEVAAQNPDVVDEAACKGLAEKSGGRKNWATWVRAGKGQRRGRVEVAKRRCW